MVENIVDKLVSLPFDFNLLPVFCHWTKRSTILFFELVVIGGFEVSNLLVVAKSLGGTIQSGSNVLTLQTKGINHCLHGVTNN